MIRIKAILMHRRPHFDEILSDELVREFGRDMYPGIEDAEIILEGAATTKMLGESVENLRADGIIALGRWGSEFDEHPGVYTLGVPDKCTADLVAEKLGVTNKPSLQPLIKFAHQADLKAVGHQLDLACMVKTMHSVYRNDPFKVIAWTREGIKAKLQEEVMGRKNIVPQRKTTELVIQLLGTANDPALQRVLTLARSDNQPFGLGRVAAAIQTVNSDGLSKATEWAKTGLQAVYQKQLAFFRAQEVVKNARGELVHYRGKVARVVIAQTDEEQFNDAARFVGAAVVIQQQPSENVQIYTNKDRRKLGFSVNMDRVAQDLRMAEQEAKHAVLTTDPDELASEGMVAGAEEWYYHLEGQMLLNGSLTTDNDPTKVPLDEIVEIVKRGVRIFW